MARSPIKRFKRVYWDSCTWISLVQNETSVPLPGGGTENRAALARAIIDDAEKGAAEIVTSALSLAEVNKFSVDAGEIDSPDKLADFFENEFIIVAMLDRRIGEKARRLMQDKHAGLKPLDAVHVASALAANVDEMHSFDTKLLGLNEKLDKADGTPLKVCKPALGGPPLPLLESPPEVLNVQEAELTDNSEEPTREERGIEERIPRGDGQGDSEVSIGAVHREGARTGDE